MIKIFLNSPFQVICAAEFIAAVPDLMPDRKGDDCEVFLLPTATARNSLQAIETANRLGIQMQVLGGKHHGTPWGKLRKLIEFNREIKALSEKDVLVIGNPRLQAFATAISSVNCDKWALDDGIMSARYLQSLSSGGAGWSEMLESVGSRLVTRYLAGRKQAPDWRTVRWYTIFARDFQNLKMVYQNGLERLRSRSGPFRRDATVLFLGSPLVKERVLNRSTYSAFCRQAAELLRKRYAGHKLVYLCHRLEGSDERQAQRHFDVAELSTGPVELRWLEGRNRVPAAVAGIISTALISLSELLPDSTDMYVFWPDADTPIVDPDLDPVNVLSLFEQVSKRGKLTMIKLGTDPVSSAR